MRLKRQNSFLLWAGLCALAVFTPACGDDDDDGGNGQQCQPEQLTAGSYSFMVDGVDDLCADGFLEPIIREFAPYGPVTLPSFAQLQEGPQSVQLDLPLVGTITVDLSYQGGEIVFSVAQGDYTIQGCVASVSAQGTICPVSQSNVGLTGTFTLHDLGSGCEAFDPFVDVPCTVTVDLSGDLQLG
ncbi:MAG: hypothetical protein AB1640_04500 [bacterium]